jgi:hypothetical protein
MRLRMWRMARALRSIAAFLFVVTGIVLQAQYVRDVVPKCPFARFGDYRIWSPDCHSYIEHRVRHLGRSLNEEFFSNGPQPVHPSVPVVFTTPPTSEEHWTISERGIEFVAHDSSEQVRANIASHCPGCSLGDIRATKWLDSERMLLFARAITIRGETYDLQYVVVARSGKILLAPKSWPSPPSN